MEFGARRVLHAVRRPRAAVSREVFCRWLVPVAAQVHRISAFEKLVDQFIQRWNNFVAMRHRQRTSWTEIVLHVHDQQGLFGIGHDASMLH